MAIPSPCNKVCSIDKESGLCFGCARSMDEIGRWSKMDDQERNAIMAEIDSRMQRHFGIEPKVAASTD